MATNSSTPEQREIVNVEILHLGEEGYGPQGLHTRKAWRDECLENLMLGSDEFILWQKKVIHLAQNSLQLKDFSCNIVNNNLMTRVNVIGVKNSSENLLNPNQLHRYTLDFAGQEFDIPFLCSGYEFIVPTIFSLAKFHDWATFNSCKFRANVHFVAANFYRHVHFEKSNFLELANFNNSYFGGYANFERSHFQKASLFNKIKFNATANFENAQFDGTSVFNETIFDSFTKFSNTTFADRAAFQGVVFNASAIFRNAKFQQQCEFQNTFNKYHAEWSLETTFHAYADFENVVINNVGHFERVNFKNYIPSFLGVDIATTRLEFSDDRFFAKTDFSEDAIKRLGLLKRLSEEHGQTEQALNFNAMDLKAKASSDDANWNFIIVTWLYRYLSNFGRSFTRPLIAFTALFGISYIGALIFAGNSAPIVCKEQMLQYNGDIRSGSPVSCLSYAHSKDEFQLSGYRAAFEYAAYRSSGILDFSDNDKQTSAINMRVFDQNIEPGWVRVWGAFKAIASTALLFLVALGLRNKYRIK